MVNSLPTSWPTSPRSSVPCLLCCQAKPRASVAGPGTSTASPWRWSRNVVSPVDFARLGHSAHENQLSRCLLQAHPVALLRTRIVLTPNKVESRAEHPLSNEGQSASTNNNICFHRSCLSVTSSFSIFLTRAMLHRPLLVPQRSCPSVGFVFVRATPLSVSQPTSRSKSSSIFDVPSSSGSSRWK